MFRSGSASGASRAPRALAVRWPTLRECLLIGFSVAVLVVSNLLSYSPYPAVLNWILPELLLAAVLSPSYRARSLFSSAAANSPSATALGLYRKDLIASAAIAAVTGVAAGSVDAVGYKTFSSGLVSFFANEIGGVLPLACLSATIAMLVTGLVLRVKLVEATLFCRYRDRVRLLKLLEEASRLQVLRQAGVVYQFRHAALQDRLAALRAKEDHRKPRNQSPLADAHVENDRATPMWQACDSDVKQDGDSPKLLHAMHRIRLRQSR